MRLSAVAFLMILTTVFLSGCAQQKTASLEDRGSAYYGRKLAATKLAESSPTVSYAQPRVATPTPAMIPPINPQATLATASRWQWPVEGTVIEQFGPQRNGMASGGISIAAPKGAPIKAAQAGEVAFVGKQIRDYGNMVILRHGNGTLTSYAHADAIRVRKGEAVAAGQVIATVGQSGSAKTPQLHFALREGTHAVDPLAKLPQRVASN